MIRLLISILFVSFLFTGCKSIKKTKSSGDTSFMLSASIESVDSSSVVFQEIAKEIEEQETTETIEQTFTPFDSAGSVIFLPVTITKKTTKSVRTSDSTKNESEIKVETTDQNKSDQSASQSSAVDKASVGMDPIESIATALFPTWGKILAPVIVALVTLIWGIWSKRKKSA